MKIQLTNTEVGMLLIHMGIMRKEIKKALKRNYSFFEAKRQLACYDSIIDLLARVADDTKKLCYIEFSDEQKEMLASFIYSYTTIIKQEAGREKIDASDILQAFENIAARLEGRRHAYAETI
ncbi:hypothetical protein [Geobacillus sp. ZGt-1]|uniref:hypothetical protein n=1 Tax=Geobacillus sp. ZGt-1 TaxID=1631556 RepID=UPI00069C54FB|nr:hypothetical protein [Geobacillus sp. ZGt-1]